jgi:formylglycine-generating enzyme required for sulfatase activity
MSKLVERLALACILGASMLGGVLWLLPVDLGLSFGYYSDFNIAKRALQKSECVELIEEGVVNEGTGLNYFSLKVHTKTGWKVELSFFKQMNASQVYENPKGILVYHPVKQWQAYSLDELSSLTGGKILNLKSVRDIICHLDDLAPIFHANFENEEIRSTSRINGEFLNYLVFQPWPWKSSTSAPPAVRETKTTETKERTEPGLSGLPLRKVEFDIVTLDSSGRLKTNGSGQAQYYTEPLGDNVTLEMIKVPAGSFMMGTSDPDAKRITAEYKRYRGSDFKDLWQEIPQHQVTVPAFYMGKFEVTQGQWRALARLPRINIDLPSDPSRFKGDGLPVETISWDEAVEFCERLSRVTGRQYRLPSEAEWEYACRAGTSSQYYFGNAVTPDLANYDATYPYLTQSAGVNRETTTMVGSVGVPNAFGLYDMLGNVEEMCMDSWHDTYKGAPSDGRIWSAGGDNNIHVARGGTFELGACFIRTARRSKCYGTTHGFYSRGLRVVAVVGMQ